MSSTPVTLSSFPPFQEQHCCDQHTSSPETGSYRLERAWDLKAKDLSSSSACLPAIWPSGTLCTSLDPSSGVYKTVMTMLLPRIFFKTELIYATCLICYPTPSRYTSSRIKRGMTNGTVKTELHPETILSFSCCTSYVFFMILLLPQIWPLRVLEPTDFLVITSCCMAQSWLPQ